MDEALANFFVYDKNVPYCDEPGCTDALLAQTEQIPNYEEDEFEREYIQKQKKNLIEEARRIRKEEMKRDLLCFGAWFAFFGLIMAGVVFLATRRNIPSEIKEVIEQSLDSNVKNWKANMGLMECHWLAKRNLLFHSDVKNDDNMSSLSFRNPAVFFLKDESDLTIEEACGLESIAYLLAELMVYAVQLKCKKTPLGPPTNKYKTILTDSYKNLMAINVEGKKFFRGTPMSGRWECKSNLAEQQAMLLAAWRFGGLVIHPGIALKQRSFINFQANEVHFSSHYIVSYTKCNPSVYYLLTVIANQPKQETVFDITKQSKEIFDKLCCAGICPNIITNDDGKVCEDHCPLVEVKNVTDLAKYCPKIWKALEDSLRTSG